MNEREEYLKCKECLELMEVACSREDWGIIGLADKEFCIRSFSAIIREIERIKYEKK